MRTGRVLLLGLTACQGTPHPVSLELPAELQLAPVERAEVLPLKSWLWVPEVQEEAPMDVLEKCWAGEDVVGQLPLEVSSVTVAPGQAARVGSAELTHVLGDGSFPTSSRRGMLVVPVYEALHTRLEETRRVEETGCSPWSGTGHLLLVLDERLPWETVRDLLYTAHQAGFEDMAYLVDAPAAAPAPAGSSAPLTPAEGTPWASLASQMAHHPQPVVLVHAPERPPVGPPIPPSHPVAARSLDLDTSVSVLRSGPLVLQEDR